LELRAENNLGNCRAVQATGMPDWMPRTPLHGQRGAILASTAPSLNTLTGPA
jgi:hypothetical protein